MARSTTDLVAQNRQWNRAEDWKDLVDDPRIVLVWHKARVKQGQADAACAIHSWQLGDHKLWG
jgi:hypothetical protein